MSRPSAHRHGLCGRRSCLGQSYAAEIVVLLGYVPLAEYATPGTPGLSDPRSIVPHHDAILMANHGVVTAGPDLLTAFAEWKLSSNLQKPPSLQSSSASDASLDRDVETLLEARARYGVTFPPARTKRDPLHARLLNPLSVCRRLPSGASCPSVGAKR